MEKKEVLEMEQAIFEKINKLYDIPEVTYVRESSFKIIDDKSTGTVKKAWSNSIYHYYKWYV